MAHSSEGTPHWCNIKKLCVCRAKYTAGRWLRGMNVAGSQESRRLKPGYKPTMKTLTERRKSHKTYAAIRHKEFRHKIDAIKLTAGCVDCGFRESPVALQFDHREPSKKSFKIASSTMRQWSKVLAEIEKCDVRCANCHAVKSHQNGDTLYATRQ